MNPSPHRFLRGFFTSRGGLGLAAACLLAGAGWLVLSDDASTPPEPAPAASAPTPTLEPAAPAVAAVSPATSVSIPPAPAALPPIPPDAPLVFTEFRQWAADYIAAPDAAAKSALIPRGKTLAQQRRNLLQGLIVSDPETALALAAPYAIRSAMPPVVGALLEERVSDRGMLGVIAALPQPGQEAAVKPIRRTAEFEGKIYNAHVYGGRIRDVTRPGVSLHGVAIEDDMAVSDSPLRVLDPGEPPDPVKAQADLRCPVSGKEAGYDQEPADQEPDVVAESGDTVYFLCSGGHIESLAANLSEEERAVAQEGGSGGGSRPPGASSARKTIGPNRMLYMRVTFPDVLTDPQREDDVYGMFETVNSFFMENSFGKTYMIPTVTPLLVLPRTEAWYKAQGDNGDNEVLKDARIAAREAGYETNDYELDTVRYSGGPGGFSGQAYVGFKGCWMRSSSAGVAAHEYGHNYGLWHANYWNASTPDPIGPGSNSEYGNPFSTMGTANAGKNHFTSNEKNVLNWLPTTSVEPVSASGTYRIHTHDQRILDPTRKYALTVVKDTDRTYWADLRQQWSNNPKDGILLHWDPWAYGGDGAGTQLIDTTPGTADGKNDAAIVLGRTFSDRAAGIHFTPIRKNGTSPESIDVVVNLGDFPGNQPPVATVTASATSIATNGPVTFTAVASDPDGGALAYAWDFGDGSYSTGNEPTPSSRTYATAGEYFVRCEVSDMKGGVTSASLLVTVGAPSNFSVSGRVTDGTGQPVGGVRMDNGLTGSNYRGTYTDAAGNYTITGLVAGSYTLKASLAGSSFTPVFANPVTVGPSATARDFTGAGSKVVSLTALDGAAAEAGLDPGTLRLTRTGSTASSLKIFLLRGTSTAYADAASTSDCAVAPALTTEILPAYSVTMPAGAATLDLVVTPVDDTSAEGPERVIYTLMPQSTYVVGAQSTAWVTIEDNDTTLPTVRLSTSTLTVPENAGVPVSLTVTRSGSTVAALTVSLTRTGTATAGNDYVAIPATVTIPAGASSATIQISPIDDTTIEGYETVIVSLASNSAYRIATSTSTTVTILDDDTATVTVAATDANASETGGNTGAFTITRTGDLVAPLDIGFTLRGTAEHGLDYAPIGSPVTIPAGASSATVVITPIDDTLGEPSQTVILMLANSTDYTVGSPSTATVTIADNDLPSVTIVPLNGGKESGSTAAKFTVVRNGSQGGTISVRYAVSGTAASGADFTALSGVISLTSHATDSVRATLTIPVIDDPEIEDAEIVTITLLPDPAYSVDAESSATIFIEDNDGGGRPMINISKNNLTLSETSTTKGEIYVSRVGSTTGAIQVRYSLGGTATNGADYLNQSGIFIIPDGASSGTLEFTMRDDAEAEGTETIEVALLPDAAYGIGPASAATLYINDNESFANKVRFVPLGGTFVENEGSFDVRIALDAPAPHVITVECHIAGGTALGHGIDYSFAPGTLVFAPGETEKFVPVILRDDVVPEGAETILVGLRNAHGVSIGTTSATFTITDDEPTATPLFSFATLASDISEDASPALVGVTISAPPIAPVSVTYYLNGGTATSGMDFSLPEGTVTFLAGESGTKFFPVTILDDALTELDETVFIRLKNPTGGATASTSTHTLRILDDETQRVSVEASIPVASEAGEAGQFKITRTGTTTAALTVNFTVTGTATAGSDYTALGASVVVPAGQREALLTVTPNDDAIYEGDETVQLNLSQSSAYSLGSPVSAFVTIADDKIGLRVAATDADAGEPENPGEFTITRLNSVSGDLSVGLAVTGSATAGADYAALPATVVIPDGQASMTIPVAPIDDEFTEPEETIILTPAPSSGYVVIPSSGSATVTLSDDDPNAPPAVAIVSPTAPVAGIPSGIGLLLRATVTDDGRPAPAALTIAWSKVSGPGTVTFGSGSAAETTARFSTDGTYIVRLTADDGAAVTTRDITVYAGTVPPSYTSGDIGAVAAAGSVAVTGGTFTVHASGADIWNAADEFHYVHRQLTGDGEMIARVGSLQNTDPWAKAGVMIRDGTGANARNAFMAITPSNGATFQRRDASGGTTLSEKTTGIAAPRWVHIVRSGDTFSGYQSSDGTTWTKVGASQTVTMGSNVRIGLAVTSHKDGTVCTAVFDGVTGFASGNIGPSVAAGTPIAATAGESTALSGVTSDDGLPASPGLVSHAWSLVSGPGAVGFGNANAAATTATFPAPGDYVLRLVAGDGEVETFAEVTATIAPGGTPSQTWQSGKFTPAQLDDPAISGWDTDPDGDGRGNLAEYTAGTEPLTADQALVTGGVESGKATLTYRRMKAATDVVLAPECAGGDFVFTSTGVTTEKIAEDATTETWKGTDTAAPAGAAARFMRLRMTLPEN